MKPGELVRIKRASIGVPKGTIALITSTSSLATDLPGKGAALYTVSIIGRPNHPRRYLPRDLEVISGV